MTIGAGFVVFAKRTAFETFVGGFTATGAPSNVSVVVPLAKRAPPGERMVYVTLTRALAVLAMARKSSVVTGACGKSAVLGGAGLPTR